MLNNLNPRIIALQTKEKEETMGSTIEALENRVMELEAKLDTVLDVGVLASCLQVHINDLKKDTSDQWHDIRVYDNLYPEDYESIAEDMAEYLKKEIAEEELESDVDYGITPTMIR